MFCKPLNSGRHPDRAARPHRGDQDAIVETAADHLDLEDLAPFGVRCLVASSASTPAAMGTIAQAKLTLPTDRLLFIEGESRKVGPVIPTPLAKTMQEGPRCCSYY